MAQYSFKLQHEPIEFTNEQGEVLFTLDIEDLSFPLRFQKLVEDMQKIENKQKQKEIIISKKEDKEEGLMSKNQREILKSRNEALNEERKVLDAFFGEGTSERVFGPKNYVTMFFDFFSVILPALDEAGVQLDNTYDLIKKKYGIKDDEKEL